MTKQLSLEHCVGLPKEDILKGKYNLWFGMSDTPWFHNVENLRNQIDWVLKHTTERMLVCIPGRMHAINYQYLEKCSRAKALRQGFALENSFHKTIELLISKSPLARTKKVVTADYDELLTPTYIHRRKALYKAFSEEGSFYTRIIDIGTDFLQARQRTITKERLESIALYQLQELPMFIAPIASIHEPEVFYDAIVYPGFGKLDILARELVDGTTFPELTEQLQLTKPCGIVSVDYMEASDDSSHE